jgi:hypothetical protein
MSKICYPSIKKYKNDVEDTLELYPLELKIALFTRSRGLQSKSIPS